MYPTKPSLGWCLLMAWERCHSPRNVGCPAIGCMVARIDAIAYVVYLAIVVGGLYLYRMMGATTVWEH